MKRAAYFLTTFFIWMELSASALAVQIEVQIPGAGTSTDVPNTINNFYRYSLWLGGILAFGAVVYGGVKYIFAAGNPSGQSEGKDWIKSALLGLLILAGAYLILNVINPNLTQLNFPTLTPQAAQGTGASGGINSGQLIYGCIADNGVVACSPGNLSNCSDDPACSGKPCNQVQASTCGQTTTNYLTKVAACIESGTNFIICNQSDTSQSCTQIQGLIDIGQCDAASGCILVAKNCCGTKKGTAGC